MNRRPASVAPVAGTFWLLAIPSCWQDEGDNWDYLQVFYPAQDLAKFGVGSDSKPVGCVAIFTTAALALEYKKAVLPAPGWKTVYVAGKDLADFIADVPGQHGITLVVWDPRYGQQGRVMPISEAVALLNSEGDNYHFAATP